MSLGGRGQHLLEAAGHAPAYARPLPSLGIPTYVEVERIALDLLDLTEQGVISSLVVLHNAPVRRFEYGLTVRTLLPPELPAAPERQAGLPVKPATDVPNVLNHLLTERLIVQLYQAIVRSSISEQLARVQAMRLAGDNAQKVFDDLGLRYQLAERQAMTASLLEVLSGYQAAFDDSVAG
jgi:F-type H+-transporting ATPase subunit gamma